MTQVEKLKVLKELNRQTAYGLGKIRTIAERLNYDFDACMVEIRRQTRESMKRAGGVMDG